MKIELITGTDALEGIGEEWSALAKRCEASPFQNPDWLLPWCRHLGPSRLQVLALRDSGRLVGLAPWFFYRSGAGGTRVCFLGAGVSDYLDVLVEAETRERALASMFGYLEEERGSWDVCDLDELPPRSVLRGWPRPWGWSESIEARSVCPALELPRGHPRLEAAVPRRQMKRLRYYRRRMERAGPVEIRSASPGEELELMDELFRLHEARWSNRDQPGVLATDPLRNFHRDVARRFSRRGLMALYRLRFRGRVLACYYGIFDRAVLYCYLGGFAPEIASYSPGLVLLGSIFEDAISKGARVIDLLRGAEPYKYAWGAIDRVNLRRRLWRTT